MRPIKLPRHALLVVAILASLCAAESEAVTVAVMGYPTCGAWVQKRNSDGTPSFAASTWVMGFLSGAAWGTAEDLLNGIDQASIEVWMDNYCHANPLSDVSSGSTILIGELKAKKAKKKT